MWSTSQQLGWVVTPYLITGTNRLTTAAGLPPSTRHGGLSTQPCKKPAKAKGDFSGLPFEAHFDCCRQAKIEIRRKPNLDSTKQRTAATLGHPKSKDKPATQISGELHSVGYVLTGYTRAK